jgi:2-polyprenyl-6-methoxyphenol hydroxylase-like FAD-dependent oxidoreductase
MNGTVLVVGAGPTGLMLAGELACAGVPTIVLERHPEPNTRSAGMAVHGRTMELFDQRGLGDRIRADGSFVWPRTPFALMWLDLETVDERDHTIAYPQWRTERLLEARATELGVDIRRGHEVLDVKQTADEVIVQVRGPNGEYQLSGTYLVGCDGADSVVRGFTGIEFVAEGITHHGMFADLPSSTEINESFAAGLHPTGMAAAMPIGPETLRLMAIELNVEPPSTGTATVEELREMIVRITGAAPDLAGAKWVQRFGGRTRLAERYRDDRVFLAGDAAHSLFISGTQGLNAGIQDAVNLGWKLAAAVAGWAPEDLLDTYHGERHPVGHRMCTHARAVLTLLYKATGKTRPLRELFAEFLRFDSVNRFLLQLPTAADYPRAEGAHPLTGTRLPNHRLSTPDGPRQLFADFRPGKGMLLDLSGGTATVPDLTGWADRVSMLRAGPLPEPTAEIVLLRPDGYVAYAGDDTGLVTALTTWFGTPA